MAQIVSLLGRGGQRFAESVLGWNRENRPQRVYRTQSDKNTDLTSIRSIVIVVVNGLSFIFQICYLTSNRLSVRVPKLTLPFAANEFTVP